LTVAVNELAGAKIAIFANPTYVDTENTPGEHDAEYVNLKDGLIANGHQVSPFTGIAANDFSNALSGKDVLVIPELENASLVLAPDAAKVIRDFVGHGGTLVINGETGDNDTDFLNSVFGFSVNNGGELNSLNAITKQPAAAGTTFAGDPTTIPGNDGTYTLYDTNLPSNALKLYSFGTAVAVADIPFGAGQVVYLGWDWFDGKPDGSQDNGWLEVLKSAISETDGIIRGTAGPDSVSPFDTIPGQAFASDYQDIIYGFAGSDLLGGGGGNDFIYGGRDADILSGADGFDRLYGGRGNDYLEDDLGGARLYGGRGHDTFAFSNLDAPATAQDFRSGFDVILLDHNTFTLLPDGDLARSAFHNGKHATTDDQRIIYQKDGDLLYDPDGSGPLVAHRFATFKDHPLIKHGDFQIHEFG